MALIKTKYDLQFFASIVYIVFDSVNIKNKYNDFKKSSYNDFNVMYYPHSLIKEENCYYIDKTELVAKLLHDGTYYFLSRPRRFGKSLFLDTLKEAFSGSKELFTGLYPENNWDWNKKYPIIHLSFGGGVIKKVQELEIVIHEILNELALEDSLGLQNQSIQGKFRE